MRHRNPTLPHWWTPSHFQPSPRHRIRRRSWSFGTWSARYREVASLPSKYSLGSMNREVKRVSIVLHIVRLLERRSLTSIDQIEVSSLRESKYCLELGQPHPILSVNQRIDALRDGAKIGRAVGRHMLLDNIPVLMKVSKVIIEHRQAERLRTPTLADGLHPRTSTQPRRLLGAYFDLAIARFGVE